MGCGMALMVMPVASDGGHMVTGGKCAGFIAVAHARSAKIGVKNSIILDPDDLYGTAQRVVLVLWTAIVDGKMAF